MVQVPSLEDMLGDKLTAFAPHTTGGIMWELCGNFLVKQMPLKHVQRHFWRCVAESNHCDRFCRPAPSHSANAPYGIAKLQLLFEFANKLTI